jgi:hypothetical protein
LILMLQMILLENAESQKKHYERKCEDMATRLRDTEKSLQNAQKQITGYQVWRPHQSYCFMGILMPLLRAILLARGNLIVG